MAAALRAFLGISSSSSWFASLAIGTLVGGAGVPFLFGLLINSGSKAYVALGCAPGATLMLLAALCEWRIGVEAANKSLESISKPLQSKG